jgi:hypothetical protein
VVQAGNCRPLTAEARVRSCVIPCGIYGGQNYTGTGFSPSTSFFPRQFHYTGAPLHEKTKKKTNHTPQTAHNRNLENTDIVDITISKVLCDFPFSRSQSLKSADD